MSTLELVDVELARWVRRYERHLDQISAILEVLRDEAIPLKSARYDGVRVSASREHAPLPFRVERVDASDDLWAALAQYLGHVVDLLGDTITDSVSWTRGGEAVGLSSAVSGRQARALAFQVIAWLTDRAPVIATFDELQDTEDFLFSMVRKLRTQHMVPAIERPAGRRLCTLCGEQAVTASWVDGVNDRPVLTARCRRCGATYEDKRGAA